MTERLLAITRCCDELNRHSGVEDEQYFNLLVELHKLLYGLWPGESHHAAH